MALQHLLAITPLSILLPALLLLSILALCIYNLYLHPLSHIPGPLICRLSPLWTYYHSYIGDEATLITALHTTYNSPIIRVAPNEICISDGACLAPIYSEKGGFAKAECYRNFDIDGFASLFSELSAGTRAPKAKSVVPLFSTASLRRGEGVLVGCVEDFVRRLREEKRREEKTGKRKGVDVLGLSRGLALDAVTAYLFGKSYGGLDEGAVEESDGKSTETGKKEMAKQERDHSDIPRIHMSASDFVDAFVGVGRFFYLPNYLFVAIELLSEKFFGTQATATSLTKVDEFVRGVVEAADPEDGSYPGRMLKAGLKVDEVVAQCKDLMFAGTDSSGMNLSTLCWQLARSPDM